MTVPVSMSSPEVMKQSTRIWAAVFLSILSGALLFLAFPPVNLWYLMWIAAVPYLVAQHRFMPRRWTALAPTIAYGLWLWPFLYRIFGIPDAPFYLKHMGLLIAVLVFFTSTDRKFNELTGFRWFVLQGLSAWVGFEMIRSFIPVLGTMGFAANPLAGQAWLIQPVSVFSIYGLNLLIVLVNFSLAQVIMHWVDKNWALDDSVPVDGRSSWRWLTGAGVALAIWIAISLVIYNRDPGGETIRVAALHQDLRDPGHQVDEAEMLSRLALLREQALEAAALDAEVIYIPEMALGFDPQHQHTEELQAITAETGAYLFIVYAYRDAGENWHNETVMLSPDGTFSPVYGKQHAFGEPPTVTAGTFMVNDTPYGKLGSIICMDGVFTDSARNTAKNGAQILAIPSYDTTVGISEQNWTHFVMRAVENQVPMVNTDRGYYSVITDTHGEILADVRTPEGASKVITADVTLSTANPFYHVIGDFLGWVSLGGFVFFMVFQTVVERKAKKKETL